jgi:pilus assembly protein CpaB
MKAARILVLGVALAAGGAAASLVSSDEKKPEPAAAPVVQRFPIPDVLIAKAGMDVGTAVSAQDLSWPRQADRGNGEINTLRYGVSTNR